MYQNSSSNILSNLNFSWFLRSMMMLTVSVIFIMILLKVSSVTAQVSPFCSLCLLISDSMFWFKYCSFSELKCLLTYDFFPPVLRRLNNTKLPFEYTVFQIKNSSDGGINRLVFIVRSIFHNPLQIRCNSW